MTIKEAREQQGMSRQNLSDWLEIPYRTLTNWENGERSCPAYIEKLIVEKIKSAGNASLNQSSCAEKKTILAYPVIFTETHDTILIEVPDLKLYTESNGIGDKKGTIAKAMMMAREIIGLDCEEREREGKSVIEPSLLQDINPLQGTFANEGKSFVSLVDIKII